MEIFHPIMLVFIAILLGLMPHSFSGGNENRECNKEFHDHFEVPLDAAIRLIMSWRERLAVKVMDL
jgi:hypothetical protein